MGEGRDGHRPQWAPDAESERSPALWLSHGTTGLCRTPAPGRTITSSRSQWGRRSADSCTFEPPSFPAPAPHRPRRRQGRPAALPLSAPDMLRSASQPLPRCSSASGSATSVRPAVKHPSPRVSSAVPWPSAVSGAASSLRRPPLVVASRPRRRLPLAGRGLVVAFPALGASACFRTAPQPALLPASSAPERSCHLRASSAPSLATLTLDVASCPSVRLLTSSILVVR